VILVIDTSGSMVANDVEPTRLAAAQEAMRRFIGKLPGRFRIGMVTFSSQARVAVPITEDHDLAAQGIERLTPYGGTAIGDAIGRSLELLQESAKAGGGAVLQAGSKVPPAAIVLMSDGAQNRGQLQPIQAALRAKRLKIPVYTVALGTAGGSIRISDGAFQQVIPVPPDPQTLRQIALETGGQFYAAASSARLKAVWETLASRLSTRREYREATYLFLGVSALLLLGAGALSAFWLPRLP
jgi:Ca-activated chloride channel family protein